MKRLLPFLLLCASGYAQTVNITVTADTNRTIRTNFTIGNAQVTGLSSLLDQKLSLTGNGSGVTNLNPDNLSVAVPLYKGGTGGTNASEARSNLQLGSAATNDASAFQPASSVLTNLVAGDGSSLTNVTVDGSTLTNVAATNLIGSVETANGGTGGTNAASGLANLLPAYASNASKVLAVNTNEDGVEWIAAGGGGGLPETPLAISNGGTGADSAVLAMSNFGFWNQNKVVLTTSTTNVGTSAVAIGTNAQARGVDTVSIGNAAFVFTNRGGVAVGYDARVATGNGIGVAVGFNSYAEGGVGIGYNAEALTYTSTNIHAVAIGWNSEATDNGVAIGKNALVYFGGGAVGEDTVADRGFAGGRLAQAWGTNNIQLGTGENYDEWTMQIFGAGTVDTNEWSRIAALSTYPTTNISVVGTNNTNTLVFSNGILVEVQ